MGLPIIFQRMGNGPLLDGHLDGARRLASPVLLKSLPTGKQEAVALALLLDAPHVWDDGTPGVRLNGADRPLPREQLVGNNAARVPAPLMKDGAGRVYESAREAFMAFAASSPGWRPALERFEFE